MYRLIVLKIHNFLRARVFGHDLALSKWHREMRNYGKQIFCLSCERHIRGRRTLTQRNGNSSKCGTSLSQLFARVTAPLAELLEVSERQTQNIFCCEMALNGHKNTNLYIFNATSSAARRLCELSSAHISFHPQQINDKLPGRSTKSVT